MRRFHFTLIVTTVCLCLPAAADKPVPASLKVDGTKLSIQWQARAGVAYQLQGSNDRVNWKNHGGIRMGPTANSAAVGTSYQYYRVLELKASVNTNQPSKDTARKTPAGRVKTSAGNAPAPRTMSETEAKQLGLTAYKAFLFLNGNKYEKGKGVPQDYKEAVKWYRKAAEQGDAVSQGRLGDMYRDGKGVPQNAKEAAKWYQKAAEQGNAHAQLSLGLMYYLGLQVQQDYNESAKWFRKAAEGGMASAAMQLGSMYDRGEGVPQDYKEAVKWSRKAAEQGNALAQVALGDIYEEGKGVPQDYKEAVKWYRKAAAQGNAMAQLKLGVMYATGEGVLEDDVTAYAWANIAAANGDAKGKKLKGIIVGRMTPEQIAKAQELSRVLLGQIEAKQAGGPGRFSPSIAPRIDEQTGLPTRYKLMKK